MAERKLNGIWNAARVLQELLRFTDDRGNIRSMDLADDSPYGVKGRRFVAAMKAYGKEEYLNLGHAYLISDLCSEEKVRELYQLLWQNLHGKHSAEPTNLDFLKSVRERWDLFETLFRYRKSLYKVESIWSGVTECSQTIALGIKMTDSLYQTHVKAASDAIDRILILLLGDDFDQSFTEEHLLSFGYPNVSDEELEDMMFDNW